MSSAEYKRHQRVKSREAFVVFGDIVWTLIEDIQGPECYQMTCSCGNTRLARPNSLFQVVSCEDCAFERKRLAKRRKKV